MPEAAQIVEDRFVAVPGGDVFVRTWTPGELGNDEPLILLHDSIGCVELWRDLPQTLAILLRRPIVAYDRLGYGRSTPRDEPIPLEFIREEAEMLFPPLVEALDYGSFSLFGYSVGGGIALTTAATAGDACTAVVSESAQTFVEERTIRGVIEAKERFADPGQFRKLEKYHGDKTRWVLDAWLETWLSPDRAGWSLRDTLPHVRCPVLAVHGDRDDYGSEAFPELIRDLSSGPVTMVLMEDCGHMPHREHEARFLGLLSDFLEIS